MKKSDDVELTPRARAKRDQIRDAAQRLFLRDGFAATSTDALAAEAGVSKQTLYAYYPSKEALLSDVLQHLIRIATVEPTAGRKRPFQTEKDLRRAVIALAETSVEQLMQPEYLALLRVIATETPRYPHLSELFRKSVPEQLLGSVAALLANARAAGLVQVESPALAARMLIGPLLTYAILDGLLAPEDERRPPSRRQVENWSTCFCRELPRVDARGLAHRI